MQAERDYLVRLVFPRLRAELVKRRIMLIDVDLRWGVPSDQDALALCLDEIERCHPRFISLLGGRYGYTPPPPRIPLDLATRVMRIRDGLDVLPRLYDATEGEYRLKSRPRMLQDQDARERDELRLAEVFRQLGEHEMSASITMREILEGALGDSQRPAFRYFYFRDHAATATVSERYGSTYREPVDTHAETALAKLKEYISMESASTLVRPGVPEERALSPFVYHCRWEPARARFVDLDGLGDRVFHDLLHSVDAEFGPHVPDANPGIEGIDPDSYFDAHRMSYVEDCRRSDQDALLAHCDGRDPSSLLLVTGPPGIGKTSVLVQFTLDWVTRASLPTSKAGVLHSYLPGINCPQSSLHDLLRRMTREFGPSLQNAGESLPSSVGGLQKLLQERLTQRASDSGGIIVVVDSLDQLEGSTRPELLAMIGAGPPSVRWLVGVNASFARAHLEKRGSGVHALPFLTSQDSTTVATTLLRLYRKTLAPEQLNRLLGKADSNVPLYLRTAVEELRTIGVYESLTRTIDAFPESSTGLFAWIMTRLRTDPVLHDRLESDDVAWIDAAFGALAIARRGLPESTLAALVTDGCVESRAPIRAAAFAALLRLARPHLTMSGGRVTFAHSQMRDAALAAYAGDKLQRTEAHRRMAQTLMRQADPGMNGSWSGEPYAISELPYHLLGAGDGSSLRKVLTDVVYLEQRCARGLRSEGSAAGGAVWDVLEDLRLAAEQFEGHPWIDELARFFRASSRVIELSPEIVFQEAINQNWSPTLKQAALAMWQANADRRPWLERLSPEPQSDLCQLTIDDRTFVTVVAASTSRDLLVSASLGGYLGIRRLSTGVSLRTVKTADHGFSLSLSADGSFAAVSGNAGRVSVWRVEDGSCLFAIAPPLAGPALVTLTGDTPTLIVAWLSGFIGWFSVKEKTTCEQLVAWEIEKQKPDLASKGMGLDLQKFTFTPDGTRLWGAEGNRLTEWNACNGKRVATIEMDGGVSSVKSSADGQTIAVGRPDGSATIWDAVGRREIVTVRHEALKFGVISSAFSPDTDKLATASNGDIILWSLPSGRSIGALRGHTNVIFSCLFADRSLISASMDGTIRVWDTKTLDAANDALAFLRAPGAISQDGRTLASTGTNGGLVIWTTGDWARRTVLDETVKPTAIAFSPDAHTVAAATRGGLRVFDLETRSRKWAVRLPATEGNTISWAPDGGALVVSGFRRGTPVRSVQEGFRGSSWMQAGFSEDGAFLLYPDPDVFALFHAAQGSPVQCVLNSFKLQETQGLEGGKEVRPAYPGVGVLSVASGREVSFLPVPENAALMDCAWSPDAAFVAVTTSTSGAAIWDARRGVLVSRLPPGHPHEVWTASTFTSDRRFVLSAGHRNASAFVVVWETLTGEVFRQIDLDGGPVARLYRLASPNLFGVVTVDMFPHRPWFRVFDLETGMELARQLDVSGMCEATSLGGERVLAWGSGDLVSVWELKRKSKAMPVATFGYMFRPALGRYDADLSAACPWCGHRVVASQELARSLLLGQQPGIAMADAAGIRDMRDAGCKRCGSRFAASPFVADTRSWTSSSRTAKHSAKPMVDIPVAHHASNGNRAAALNIAYQAQLQAWKGLPRWKRWWSRRPRAPKDI